MTEAEWRRCKKPSDMIGFLREWPLRHSAGARRKARLLTAAFCRQVWDQFKRARSRRLVELSERYAEGEVAFGVLKAAWDAEKEAWRKATWPNNRWPYLACNATHRDIWLGALDTWAGFSGGDPPLLGNPEQVGLIRDVFGSLPFRPAKVDPRWLMPDVRATAQAAYEERCLPSGELDPARLAVLADALEDAGCSDAEVQSHLRSDGPHVRGCWAVDLILGKE